MKTITLKLTNKEFELVYSSLDKANLIDIDLDDSSKIGFSVIDGMNTKTYIVSFSNIDKFKEFLNDEMLNAEFHRITNPRKYYLMKADNVFLKSILSKLDEEVAFNNPQEQMIKDLIKDNGIRIVEGLDVIFDEFNAEEGEVK